MLSDLENECCIGRNSLNKTLKVRQGLYMVENWMLVKAFEMRSAVFKAGLKEAGCAEANGGWRLEQTPLWGPHSEVDVPAVELSRSQGRKLGSVTWWQIQIRPSYRRLHHKRCQDLLSGWLETWTLLREKKIGKGWSPYKVWVGSMQMCRSRHPSLFWSHMTGGWGGHWNNTHAETSTREIH